MTDPFGFSIDLILHNQVRDKAEKYSVTQLSLYSACMSSVESNAGVNPELLLYFVFSVERSTLSVTGSLPGTVYCYTPDKAKPLGCVACLVCADLCQETPSTHPSDCCAAASVKSCLVGVINKGNDMMHDYKRQQSRGKRNAR